MSTAQAKRRLQSAFTLLEITLAVVILAMMSLAIYRFVQANLTALRVSAEVNVIDARYSGFESMLATQWQSLPSGVGALLGEPFKLNDRPRDEITWVCSAGPGLLTRYAAGEYRVSLRLRPTAKDANTMEIGIARRPNIDETNAAEQESWIPLLPNVQSIQIRYFDPRLNTWVERWTDRVTLPRLVKVAIARSDSPAPWEAIIPLGRTPL
jgi:prepilin-type N-terminal cleavage/methylation domain-containing protein